MALTGEQTTARIRPQARSRSKIGCLVSSGRCPRRALGTATSISGETERRSKRISRFLSLQRSTVGVIATVVLVGMGERMVGAFGVLETDGEFSSYHVEVVATESGLGSQVEATNRTGEAREMDVSVSVGKGRRVQRRLSLEPGLAGEEVLTGRALGKDRDYWTTP
jgi:hypothetical protein